MYEYIGNLHIHSSYSDGAYKIDKIAQLANKAGLDFIYIADHENLKGLYNREEGYRHDVLTLIGEEVNDTCNHYLALNINKLIPNNTENPQEVINEVNNQGGLGIIAHPIEKGSPLYMNGKTFNWTDFNVTDFQGIEIWNYLSQWKDGIRGLLSGIYLLFNPHKALIGPYPEVMNWYDELQSRGYQVIAFCGSDAHNTKIKLGPISIATIGPYYYSFRCLNMHILAKDKLTGDFPKDKETVIRALKTGNCWIGYDFFHSSKRFRFVVSCKDNTYYMGEKIKLNQDMYISLKLPQKAKARIIKDGHLWKKLYGDNFRIKVNQKGVYRVEVYHKHGLSYRPWIYSNSIWIL